MCIRAPLPLLRGLPWRGEDLMFQDSQRIDAPAWLCALLLMVVIGGCAAREASEVVDDPAEKASVGLELDALFPTDRVLDIQIQLAPEDWDALRFQTRDFASALNAQRKYAPLKTPYEYVSADVSIDGKLLAGVGLRKKGFLGSQNTVRPSLKLKLNKFEKGRSIDGLKVLTLNNNQQDASLMSQFMGYAFFNRVGVPAPRCAYARVTVNGTYLGIYTHVESIRKPLIRRHFGNADGTLYEGTVVDFFPGWSGSFEREFGNKEAGLRHIEALTVALEGGAGEALLTDDAAGRAWIPVDGSLGDRWTAPEFDDSQWLAGRNGAGYERGQGYQELIQPTFDFEQQLFNRSASLYLRFPFQVSQSETKQDGTRLLLRMKYDDGYVAYLNGARVAGANAPADLQWNSQATIGHGDPEAVRYEERDISVYLDQLRDGVNVLAVHALNVNPTSTDMLLVARLEKNAFDYEREISEVVDLDAFYRFWAVEGLLGFWDGYSGNRNNYFVYLDAETGKFHFLPWGADALFEKFSRIDRTPNLPLSVKTQGRVAYRLYQGPETRRRYARTMRDILDRFWDEEALLAETVRIEEMLLPHLPGHGATNPRAGRGPAGNVPAHQRFRPKQLREFIRSRRGDLLREMLPQMPIWTRAPGVPPTIGPDVPPASKTTDSKAPQSPSRPPAKE